MKTKIPRNEAFAERFRLLIAKQKITQTVLADHLGITRAAINTYVCGRSEPCLQNLVAIAQYFDVSTDYLLGNTTVVKVKRRLPVRKTE
ncbi:MAG: helix-turn-helix transcriptional regulator [Eubacteriales bacterium]|nr:helix-turn-helix transcriptional regulator [Eubacteriales bacterium]